MQVTVDCRPREYFARAHFKHSALVDIADVDDPGDVHVQLPPRSAVRAMRVVCLDADLQKARFLFDAYPATYAQHACMDWDALITSGEAESGIAHPAVRLWRANPCLERDELAVVENALGARFKVALDLGCGSGRCSVYLAMRGWRVVAIDRDSKVLDRLAHLAACSGVTVEAHRANVTLSESALADAFALVPAVGLVVVSRFMPPRPLLPLLAKLVPSGAFICM